MCAVPRSPFFELINQLVKVFSEFSLSMLLALHPCLHVLCISFFFYEWPFSFMFPLNNIIRKKPTPLVEESYAVEEVSFRLSEFSTHWISSFCQLNNSAFIIFYTSRKLKAFIWIQRLGLWNPDVKRICMVFWITKSQLFTNDVSKRWRNFSKVNVIKVMLIHFHCLSGAVIKVGTSYISIQP